MKLIRKLLNGRALRALGVVSAFAMFASGFAHAQAAFPRQPMHCVAHDFALIRHGHGASVVA